MNFKDQDFYFYITKCSLVSNHGNDLFICSHLIPLLLYDHLFNIVFVFNLLLVNHN